VGGRYDQVKVLLGERHEGQPVSERGGLAGHADVGDASRDRRRDLQVAGRHGLVAGQQAGVDAVAGQFPVEHPAGIGAAPLVHQPQPGAGQVADAGDAAARAGPQDQALPPRAEPDDLRPGAQQLTGGVIAARVRLVHGGDVRKSGGGEPERFAARARPPRELDRRVEQRERRLQQRQGGIAAGDHQRRARRPDRLDRASRSRDIAHPRGRGAAWDDEAAGGQEAGPGRRRPGQRQRDEHAADGRQRHPAARRAERGQWASRHLRRRADRPEQVLDGHPEGAGQRQRHPQRGVGEPGLHHGDGLAGDPRHPRELLLREAPGLPRKPQADPVAVGGAVLHAHQGTFSSNSHAMVVTFQVNWLVGSPHVPVPGGRLR
jgi:hypothetical protein